jgi:alpha-L-fucosidase 2
MERSYVEVTAASNTSAAAAEAKQITDHVNWDRYLSLVQGRVAFGPIKFNGQDFNCNDTGKGWDTRGWGADYWWQNERQPYYNVLAQGDFDTMRSFLGFYRRMLPYVQARTAAQFKGTPTELKHPAALYEETCTQFGTYNEGDWGCHSPVPRQYGASANGFIRFHWTGALELSLMVLDQFDVSGDLDDLKQNLPMAVGVVEAYRQRFPNKDKNGKTDFFPAQALETYQCGDPSGKSRANCPSNPSTDIGGLKSVLPKLIALPSSVTTAQQVATWKKQLADLPPLPQGPAAKKKYNQNKIYPIATGNGFPTTGKGQRHNSENTEMYVAHPFRLFGVGKTKMPDGAAPSDITLAQQAYAERHSPCNDGWCQDIIQAAMLNMTDEAALQLAGRAAAPPAKGFRFRGFAAHYQDYEPSLDHFGFMRTGLDYMLMAPMDDEQRRILLFPTWPVKRWNVRFKMHAARNTTIEASCQDGQLEYLIVTPPARKADVVVLNCEQQ